MGTGKSVVSRRLSEILDFKFLDADREIEYHEHIKVNNIFSKHGEEYFRDLESRLIEEIVTDNSAKKRRVISCGGGIVLRYRNIRNMRSNGVIILLKASPEVVFDRVRFSNKRPILNGNMNVEFISSLMQERELMYLSSADIVVDTDDLSIEETCLDIIEKIKINNL